MYLPNRPGSWSVANSNYSQNKNPYIVQADKTFKNEAYFDAIDLYKKGEYNIILFGDIRFENALTIKNENYNKKIPIRP